MTYAQYSEKTKFTILTALGTLTILVIFFPAHFKFTLKGNQNPNEWKIDVLMNNLQEATFFIETSRNQDGSCNNLQEPKFGMRGTPFQRILENDFADGNLTKIIWCWSHLIL